MWLRPLFVARSCCPCGSASCSRRRSSCPVAREPCGCAPVSPRRWLSPWRTGHRFRSAAAAGTTTGGAPSTTAAGCPCCCTAVTWVVAWSAGSAPAGRAPPGAAAHRQPTSSWLARSNDCARHASYKPRTRSPRVKPAPHQSHVGAHTPTRTQSHTHARGKHPAPWRQLPFAAGSQIRWVSPPHAAMCSFGMRLARTRIYPPGRAPAG